MAYEMFAGESTANTEVVDTVIGATEPCCFLMVLSGTPLRLMLLHTLAWYNTTFGVRSRLQGGVFGFLGEQVDFHLLTTLQAPESGASVISELADYGVPSEAAITIQYMNASPTSLLSEMIATDDWVIQGKGRSLARLCLSAFIPRARAPHFMHELTPWQGLQLAMQLVQTLPDEVHDLFRSLLAWFRVTCMVSGNMVAKRLCSKLQQGGGVLSPCLSSCCGALE